MRTPTLVALTATASAALAAPLAIVVHDGHLHVPGVTVSLSQGVGTRGISEGAGSPDLTNPSDGQSNSRNNATQGDGSAQADPGSTAGESTTSTSGTTTTASAAQSKGVVMIDAVLPGGEAAGSGMVLTADGTVLTNYHVVAGSTLLRVTVPGGTTYTASVVGHDKSHDIAVLKLSNAKGLATVTLDQDGVRTAERILAVGQGNGEGVLYAATGQVTATNRSITASEEGSSSNSENLTGLIQTNAPIVGGYSGGPLFDADGEVVGIDTAASSTNSLTAFSGRSAQGYAIPIAQAKSIADSILAGTKTSTNHIGARAALGVAIAADSNQSPTPWGTSSGATGTSGVVVQQVLSGSPMARTGMTAGSTITTLDGTRIDDTSDVSDVMDTRSPGSSMKVTWTDASGTTHTSTVTLQKATTN